MTDLTLDDVAFHYEADAGAGKPVLDGVSLRIAAGEFVVAIGRSGCGKTTLLNLAAGYLKPTRGRVLRDGRPIAGPGADRAVVFQDDALFPWFDTRENVAFALRLRGIGAAERARRADALLARSGFTAPAKSRSGRCRAACASASVSPAPSRPIRPSC